MSWLRSGALSLSDYRIAYCEAGPSVSGSVVVCVHGAGANRDSWIPLMRNLAERGMSSLALELPGHGESDAAQISDIKEYSGIVLEFLHAKNLKSVCLTGHSMGGAVVLASVLKHTELMRGVILIGSGAKLRVKDSILEGVKSDFTKTVHEIIGYAFSPASNPSLIQEGTRGLLRCNADTMRNDFIACDRFDVLSELDSITAPALVVCGEEDLLTPPKYSQFMSEKIPNANLTIVPQAGHMVMLEQPAVVGDLISQFMNGL
ncbi:MAG: alpha/beta hydrolase [Nitrospinae bacterium]|nr:alpha/beta hydrolase [Nitrospinota bacterium]